MKLILVTGSYPPDICGIGDYTSKLTDALRKANVDVEVLTGYDWSLFRVGKILRVVDKTPGSIVHIQYPTVGYGRRLAPQALSLLHRSITTIHEFSRVHQLRRLSILPLALRSRCVIFTSDEERNAGLKKMPWLLQRSCVIPIGSNIEAAPGSFARTNSEITYFGLIVPKKGLENVIELARLIFKHKLPYRVRIIGNVIPSRNAFASELVRSAEGLPIEWTMNRSEAEVAMLLARSSVAYLPFPDGASDRRGSLKAVLSSGVVCISTVGRETHEQLKSTIVYASSPADALSKAERIFNDLSYRNKLSESGRDYAQSFNWSVIADDHIKVYKRFVGEDSGESR